MSKMLRMLALACVCLTGSAYAGDFKVGVVDTERVLRDSMPAMRAEQRIKNEFSGRDNEIKTMIQQARTLQDELDKGGAKMEEPARRSRERELNAINANLQRLQREFREDLNLRKNEELAVVLEQTNKAIQQIAARGAFDLILQEAVYRNPEIDITDQVIKYLAAEPAADK